MAVFNSLIILFASLSLAALGFKNDNVFLIIPALMFSGYMVAVFIDCFIEAWDKR